MQTFEIKGTYDSPNLGIDIDQDIIKIEGRSSMLLPHQFYPNIITFIEEFCHNIRKNLLLIIDLDYYNTLSSQYLLKIIKLIAKEELNKVK